MSEKKRRLPASERREQLLGVACEIFAEKGFEATSVEMIAARAKVSKPVVYEHFRGKEGIYAVIVDRETAHLTSALIAQLQKDVHPRIILERMALALLDYIETREAGFRILVRDSPITEANGTFSSLIGDVAVEVEGFLAESFRERKLDAKTAPMYAQMLVGMTAYIGQWWLDARRPSKEVVAAHVVNLAWNGLRAMEKKPTLTRAKDIPDKPGTTPAPTDTRTSAH